MSCYPKLDCRESNIAFTSITMTIISKLRLQADLMYHVLQTHDFRLSENANSIPIGVDEGSWRVVRMHAVQRCCNGKQFGVLRQPVDLLAYI